MKKLLLMLFFFGIPIILAFWRILFPIMLLIFIIWLFKNLRGGRKAAIV